MAKRPMREQLVGSWLHAHEEDTANQLVFRSADGPLPPSRGRMGFELRADGSASAVGIAAGDGRIEQEAKWALKGKRLILSGSQLDGLIGEGKVVRVDPDRIVVQRGKLS